MTRACLLLSTVLLALAACGTSPTPPAPAPSALPWFGDYATTYRCGDTRTATVAFDGDTMQLRVDGTARALEPVTSASGARYQAVDDPATAFWSQGDTATVTWRGERWPACVATASGAQSLRAQGKGWQLDLHGPRVSLRDQAGAPLAEGRTLGPRRIGRSVTYNALTPHGMLVVTALDKPCAGPLPRPFTVQVAWGGRVLDGCGGDTDAWLRRAVWVVEDIGGAGIVDGSRATLVFAEGGHVAGRATCNPYTGTYTLLADGISIVRTAADTMPCPTALRHQEQRFLKALDATRRLDVSRDGALLLVADDGTEVKARPE